MFGSGGVFFFAMEVGGSAMRLCGRFVKFSSLYILSLSHDFFPFWSRCIQRHTGDYKVSQNGGQLRKLLTTVAFFLGRRP